KKKKNWKPTGKVFTNVGYRWIPTGRTFAVDGNKYPLTRITSIKVVPPKKPLLTRIAKKTPPSSINSGKLKDITNVGSSSKSKSVESKISNNSEPNKNWESNVSTSSSSSRVHFRSFKSSSANMGYGGYQRGNVMISRVYYVERLSHLNFGVINDLAKQGLVRGLPKLKYQKDHLCFACSLGKSKKHTHKPKFDDSIQEKLYLLHMDLYGPMRIESINGKFLRSKDQTLEFVIKFLKKIQVCLNATV
ncbi:retrovirus-related pol polyprotein from transposon TNT 1-94, partial [Tanacetum coccineum]